MLFIILAKYSIGFFVGCLSDLGVRLKNKAINQGEIHVEK